MLKLQTNAGNCQSSCSIRARRLAWGPTLISLHLGDVQIQQRSSHEAQKREFGFGPEDLHYHAGSRCWLFRPRLFSLQNPLLRSTWLMMRYSVTSVACKLKRAAYCAPIGLLLQLWLRSVTLPFFKHHHLNHLHQR